MPTKRKHTPAKTELQLAREKFLATIPSTRLEQLELMLKNTMSHIYGDGSGVDEWLGKQAEQIRKEIRQIKKKT